MMPARPPELHFDEHTSGVWVGHGPLGGCGLQTSHPKEATASFVTSSFLLLVVRTGAPSSVLAPSSDALCS